MANPSKQKGTAAESAVVAYLRSCGVDAYREAQHGTLDVGDILIPGGDLIIEVKNCKSMDLAGWVDEAEAERRNAGKVFGWVWHKRRGKGDPADWYVTMPARQAVDMAWLAKAIGQLRHRP